MAAAMRAPPRYLGTAVPGYPGTAVYYPGTAVYYPSTAVYYPGTAVPGYLGTATVRSTKSPLHSYL